MKKLVTHNGSFHTDDIFAAAALSLALTKQNEAFEIVRTRDEALIKSADIVFDVGGIYDEVTNRFDHHQVGGAGKRDNGIEYSSVGLVWKKFGIQIAGNEKSAEIIDKKLIAPIDAGDNGIEISESKHDTMPYLLQNIIGVMRPTWREEDANEDEIFFKCVELAKIILTREIIHANDAILAEEEVLKIYNESENKKIIVLEKENYPFENTLTKFPEPLFVVCKRKINDTWGAKAIRADLKTFQNRKNFPMAWAGLYDAELQKASGVEDAIFCHRALFLAVAKSKEGAIKLAQIAVESK
ncbi:MYG1 family protein [Patescibacteria group bacterium]|nr:MYG1 family protein [Patescibacteria group bacterium]